MKNEEEDISCYKCDADCHANDKFCHECGTQHPSQGMSWDWREQPDFGQINVLLEPYGVEIIEVETGSDQHALRVAPVNNHENLRIHLGRLKTNHEKRN